MKQRYALYPPSLVFFLTLLFFVGCDKKKEVTSDNTLVKKEESHQFTYLPDYIDVTSKLPFQTITFKDVGVNGLTPQTRPNFFKELTQDLADSLSAHSSELDLTNIYTGQNGKFADPSFHLACGTKHLYIDVWKNDHVAGYSLWSGCTEEHNFAWQELPISKENVEKSLARHIAETLVNAQKESCFLKNCEETH